MTDIFTLMKKNVLPSSVQLLNVLDEVSNSLFFESEDLISMLDENAKSTPDCLIKEIKAFRQSTVNVDKILPKLREIQMN